MIKQVETERWLPIPGAEGFYSVSDLGRVRSEPLPYRTSGRQRGRVLKPYLDSKGYPIFRLCIPCTKPRTVKVHRMVAMAFIRMPEPGEQVNHNNGIKTDNRVANLEYVSCRENVRHCWDNGLHTAEHCRGARNPQAKLTEDAVRVIRREYPARTMTALAAEHGVSVTAVSYVIKGRTEGDRRGKKVACRHQLLRQCIGVVTG